MLVMVACCMPGADDGAERVGAGRAPIERTTAAGEGSGEGTKNGGGAPHLDLMASVARRLRLWKARVVRPEPGTDWRLRGGVVFDEGIPKNLPASE